MCQTCTIDTSWAATASCFLWERKKPFQALGHADCTMHPVVLGDLLDRNSCKDVR